MGEDTLVEDTWVEDTWVEDHWVEDHWWRIIGWRRECIQRNHMPLHLISSYTHNQECQLVYGHIFAAYLPRPIQLSKRPEASPDKYPGNSMTINTQDNTLNQVRHTVTSNFFTLRVLRPWKILENALFSQYRAC